MDYESMNFPNIIRDAYIQYAFNKHFSVGIGQTKLPGNRQRINSSGDLQFVDRSIVNSIFNIDRDFGVQFAYKRNYYQVRGAISSGEGRNISTSDNGLAYTGRFEILPFGQFANGGDYFEGDLAREKSRKISIGFSYCHNDKAVRTGGQLGSLLYGSADINTQIIDFIYKYNGWAFATEYISRTSPSPVTTDGSGNQRYVHTGSGQNYQGSYIFKNNIEIAGRYSVIIPGKQIVGMAPKTEQFTMGVSKYFRGHRVKLQNDITLEQVRTEGVAPVEKMWIYRFQVEVGI